eukprot:Pgem_evm1s17788
MLDIIPVKNLKMEKSEHGIESRRVFLSTRASRLSKNTNLDALVDKNTLLDSILSSDFLL